MLHLDNTRGSHYTLQQKLSLLSFFMATCTFIKVHVQHVTLKLSIYSLLRSSKHVVQAESADDAQNKRHSSLFTIESTDLFSFSYQYPEESLSDDALLQDDDEEEDDNEPRSWRR